MKKFLEVDEGFQYFTKRKVKYIIQSKIIL
jgi:hypothetical protein